MDPITSAAGLELVKLGLPGVVIFGLAWLYREERKHSASLTERLLSIQDQRVEDVRKTTTAVEANTAATNAGTSALQNLSALILARGTTT